MLWAARTAADRFKAKTESIPSGIEQAVSSTSSVATSVETSGSPASDESSVETPEPAEPAELIESN